MINLQINTTQNVNLDYTIVSIGERILAFLIDGFILYLYFTLVSLIGTALGYVFEDAWTQFGLQSLILLPALFYSLIMHSLFNGRTVGKMLMKMRVVRYDGSPVHWSNYLVRWMLRLVDIWIFFGSIGVLTILFSDRRQRLGDSAAGTVVISTKNRTKVSHTILEDVEEAYQPTFTNVTILSDKDVRLIKDTYRIAKQSTDHKTMKVLRDKVESILATNSELYDVQYLDTVLKDYSFYTQQL
ncbi:RDD family protein [Aurantibacter crassamenti]|uniref:RDD family protein n=1 Tax=Aurantibacter crassamenti TaxID=1837375 RepID=UPI0019398438|nr:RDD family protein [Aurantibacter crassamenti]MBM1107891.1 RDD family protein [Aurantibacter crassamenti]